MSGNSEIYKKGRREMLKKLNSMKIRARLKRAFVTISAMIAAVAAVGLIAMIVMSNLYSDALVNYGFAQGDVGRAMVTFADTRSALRGTIGYEEQSAIDSMVEQHTKYKGEFEEEFAGLEKTMVTDANKKIYSELKAELEEYWVLEQQIMDLGSTTDTEKCKQAQDMAMGELSPMYEQIYANLEEIMNIKVSKGSSLSDQLSVLSIALPVIIAIVIVISIYLAIHLGTGIAEGIATPITNLRDRLETFAKGDLASPFPEAESQDEIAEMVEVARDMAATLNFVIADEERLLGEMANSNYDVSSEDADRYTGDFEQILLSMRELKRQMVTTLQSIDEASTQVSAGSTNLAEASQSLAEGATEQAGAVQEMQATIMTITDNIVLAAEKAEESYQLAQQYADEADRSRGEMEMMVAAMGRINDASQKIGNIISEIEDIASQTNLLSLNASIEAARAGEAGRGFSVVADQIRQLAEQSSTAAVETRELIEGAIREVSEGNEAAERASASIKIVVEGIGKIASSSKAVSSTSADQATAMKQAEQGVNQISEVVQSNSATAEESSATSEQLSAQAICLDELIGKFNLPSDL